MGTGDNLPVGPGLWGFIAAFVLALALWLLMRNMNSRMRRMAYRERERLEQEQEQEQAAAEATSAGDVVEEADPLAGDREADSR